MRPRHKAAENLVFAVHKVNVLARFNEAAA